MKTILISAVLFALLAAAQLPPDDFLQTLSGSVQPSLGWYNDASLKEEKMIVDGSLKTDNSEWACTVASVQAPEADAMDMSFSFKIKSGKEDQVAPSVSFKFGNWSMNNYVLIPSFVYNGNRYPILGNGYNPNYTPDMYYNSNLPLTISNNPHLSVEGDSFLEGQTTNASTPAVCFFSPELKRGFILLTDQDAGLRNSGISISESADRKEATIKITAPSMRKEAAGFGYFFSGGDKAPSWSAGYEITLRFRLFSFEAAGIPDLLKRFFQVRKSWTGENNPRNLLPMSQLKKWTTDIFKRRWKTVPAGSFYKPEDSDDFQFGWVGGLTNTYPMLALDDEKERSRVAIELDFVIDKLQAPSGYFYGFIKSDGSLQSEKEASPPPKMHAMVRKNCDDLLWFIKQFILLKKQGHESFITPKWETAARNLANAFVKTWKKEGQFGQYIDPATGEIAVYNSTGGAIAPAALALASYYFKDDSYLQTAIASANYYYERDVVKQGLTGGNCGDTSQDADSQSCFGFLESLMALYSITGDKSWLDKAEVQAALCSTWAISYDAKFPPTSDIGKLNSHMAGAVWASIQNKHGAPGICTASGDYLFKLYRATGNNLYADLIRDIQHAHAEAVDMPNHRTTQMGFGTSMERIRLSDAEKNDNRGQILQTQSIWTVTAGLLMAMELPGIYWQTDKDEIRVFDHVNVERYDENGIDKIKITNPTPFDATVSIFMETSAQAKTPLISGDFYEWPTVKVAAGKSVIYPSECIPPLPCFSPKEAAVWITGDNYYFDFNSGRFQVLDRNGYGTNIAATSVSMADKVSGKLLFYSDGKNVWNKNFAIMPNGGNLISGEVFGQHALIVPIPDKKDQYFLFTVKSQADAKDNGLYYNIVDMSLNGGLGDVATDAKNKLLFADAVEALTATLHANGNDFWLATHENGTNRFVVFPITNQGVGEASFFPLGATYEPFPKGAAKGSIVISPNRAKLAFNLNTHQDIVPNENENSPLELYDFGPKTGVISNCEVLEKLSNIQTLIFSPDNTKLYVGCYNNTPPKEYGLLQFDLSAGDQAKVIGSLDFIKWPYAPMADNEPMPSFKLQLAPDGKLYSGAMGIKQNEGNQRVLFYLEHPNFPLKESKPVFRYLDSPNNKNLVAAGYQKEQSFPNFMQYYFNGLESIETILTEDEAEIPLVEIPPVIPPVTPPVKTPPAETPPAKPITAIKEEGNAAQKPITVFPNPSEAFLSVEAPSEKNLFPAHIKIYSEDGKIVHDQEIESAPFPKIDISAFKAGIYIVHIQNQTGVTSVKVIKK